MKTGLLPLSLVLALAIAACTDPKGPGGVSAQSISGSYDDPKNFPFPLIAIAAADFNRDTHVDVAMADPNGDSILIRFNNGSADFGVNPPTTITVGKNPVDIVTHDFNLDGLPDLAVACEGANMVYVLINDPAKPATFSVYPVACDAPSRLAVGRLSPDPDLDIAAASKTHKSITILRNLGGSFAPQPPIGQPHIGLDNSIVAIDIGDLDNDKDIQEITVISAIMGATPAQGRAISLFLDASGTNISVSHAQTTLLPAGYAPIDGLTHDTDNDAGHLDDLVIASSGANAAIHLSNSGFDTSGKWLGFGAPETYPLTGAGAPASLAAGSLAPQDAFADIAILAATAQRVVFLRNTTTGSPRFILESPVAAPPGARVIIADLNKDSKPDLVFPGGFILAN